VCIKGKEICEKESLSWNPQSTTPPPPSHPCCWRGPWRLVNLKRFQNMLNKLKRALKVGQPQEVPKHAQQVAKYGLKSCAKKTYHESKHLSPPSSPSNPSFVIEQRAEGLDQPQHVLEIFCSAQVPRESATNISRSAINISRSATLATTEVQHLRSFSSSRQELFPSSSYCRLKIPLLPRSLMTFSSTVLPPLSTFSSSTTCLPLTKYLPLLSCPTSHKISSSTLLSYLNNHFLDCIALYRQSHTLLLPLKIFSSLITSSCASFFFSVFTCSPRSALNVWSRCLICSQPSRIMPSRSLYAFSWHIRCTERSTYASFPIQYSISVDFRFTTLFRATWQRYYSV